MTILSIFQATIFGITQGITEFLPVSSTAHVIILENIWHLDSHVYGLNLDMFINIGTLGATIGFFWKDIIAIFKNKKLVLWIGIASLPALIFGYLFQSKIETVLRGTDIVAGSLIAVAILMLYIEKQITENKVKENKLDSAKNYLTMGFWQVLSLIPGVSRSGITITGGLFAGLDRKKAAKMSFLLSIPVTTIAIAKKMLDFEQGYSVNPLSTDQWAFYIIALLFSAVFGYLSIKFLLNFLSKYSLKGFAYYRIFLGALLLIK